MVGVLIVTTAPPVLRAQSPRWHGWNSAEARIAVGDGLHYRLQAREAFEVFRRIVEDSPEHYLALWKAARGAIVLGIMAAERSEQNRWYRVSEDYARRATQVEPDDATGHYWLAAAMGRRAVQTNPTTTARLAAAVYEEAHLVLRLDSLHAGAHNVLGTFNYEVMKMSGFSRFVARTFFGSEGLSRASWKDAERYMTRAVDLDPDFVLYHLDLGKLYVKRDRVEEARAQLQTVLKLPVVHPPDTTFQRQARQLLSEIR